MPVLLVGLDWKPIDRYMPRKAALDRAGEAVARVAAAGVLLGASERELMEQLGYNLRFRCFVGAENRHRLVVEADATKATSAPSARRRSHEDPGSRLMLGADKGYDTAAFVAEMLAHGRHVACGLEGEALGT